MALVADLIRRGTRALQPVATDVPEGVVYYVTDEGKTERSSGTAWEDITDSGGTAPSGADYLVGTSNGGLSAEIVVGTSPGGELGGTWASPTVDDTHAGSSHSSIPYTPADSDDWNSATDPGAGQDGLDQLASRVAVLERTEQPPRALTDELFVSSGLTLTESGSGETIDVVTLAVDTAVVVTVANSNFVDLTDGGATTLHSHAASTQETDQSLYDADTAMTAWDESWEWCHRGQQAVTATDTTATINHGFSDATAILAGAFATWNTGIYVSAQAATTMTLTYSNPCPAGGGTLHWTVMT